ncbi:TPA: lytic transglycosylase, partial [Burkholderia vietnamiensis]|nr:lytic transglycosylase [Burkholderia vietnamiensis]
NAYAAKVMQRVDAFRFVLEPEDGSRNAADATPRMIPVSDPSNAAPSANRSAK